MLANWNLDDLPMSQKKEGADWYSVFNPEVQRVLDVDLVHHLDHDSVVCCVRFSRDGKYLATGCNRSAQIFDVSTGQNIATLQDETVGKDGDLYIRSVCFSPDGKYLATGAEDKQIRVSFIVSFFCLLHGLGLYIYANAWPILHRFGISLLDQSDTFSPAMNKTFTPWIMRATGESLLPVAVTGRCAYGV